VGLLRPDGYVRRVGQMRCHIEENASDYDKEKLQERVAKLAGGVVLERSMQTDATTATSRRPVSKLT
jgi:hypothetical protein